ncbi:hypothetical protein Tco_0669675 [Tanacetum coccineum]
MSWRRKLSFAYSNSLLRALIKNGSRSKCTRWLAMFNKKFDKLNATVVAMLVGCESCGGPHLTKDYDDKPVSSSEDACWLLSQRQPGSLQSNKETNLNAHVNAITTRSGKKTTDPPFPFNENVVKPVKQEENDKQLHINLPFVEALSQIPKYAKFLEDILTNKKKLEDLSTVIMSEECSAILEGKLPKRMSDPKASFDEPLVLEFKDLLPHLEYAFLKSESKLPIIISSDLTRNEKEKLIKVLKANKEAIAYDIKGINPSYCTHKILLVDEYKTVVQPQRITNPKVQDVVKKEFNQGDRVCLKLFPGKLRSCWELYLS